MLLCLPNLSCVVGLVSVNTQSAMPSFHLSLVFSGSYQG